jgi:hypothetical protein
MRSFSAVSSASALHRRGTARTVGRPAVCHFVFYRARKVEDARRRGRRCADALLYTALLRSVLEQLARELRSKQTLWIRPQHPVGIRHGQRDCLHTSALLSESICFLLSARSDAMAFWMACSCRSAHPAG